MPIPNKIEAKCCDCGATVPVGQGLSDKKSNLGFAGNSWITRHRRGCEWVAAPVQKMVGASVGGGYFHGAGFAHDDGFNHWMEFGDMTESEFFGGDIGDKQ
jgi:hypothetical protein